MQPLDTSSHIPSFDDIINSGFAYTSHDLDESFGTLSWPRPATADEQELLDIGFTREELMTTPELLKLHRLVAPLTDRQVMFIMEQMKNTNTMNNQRMLRVWAHRVMKLLFHLAGVSHGSQQDYNPNPRSEPLPLTSDGPLKVELMDLQ
ncbi:hypothetical protein PM082_018755 [Marasmius tenuissimus]|nr:hypothetical protein PM082_018755 [Marasmius tenuissimus]